MISNGASLRRRRGVLPHETPMWPRSPVGSRKNTVVAVVRAARSRPPEGAAAMAAAVTAGGG